MFKFLKEKKPIDAPPHHTCNADVLTTPSSLNQTQNKGFFTKLSQGLAKTRANLTEKISNLLHGKKLLDRNIFDQLETLLITADVGIPTTRQLIQSLEKNLTRNELNQSEKVLEYLKSEMKHILHPCAMPLTIPSHIKPYIILVVGVNGSGKTTTIGKLAQHFIHQHYRVMLAAGDTFRAAAIEQLQIWGQRNHIPVIAQPPGADTAAVIYDAMEAAKARSIDILIADTAGRLHTQSGLMQELKKIKRVLSKIDSNAPHEILIILDASIGQNTLSQIKQFNEAIGITGIVMTKLDGTAKGGILFAIAEQTRIPIRYIGVGEGIDDLQPFQEDAFVDALLAE